MAFLDLPARVIERRLGGLARGVEPSRIVPLGFALIIGVVTVLFMLPVARTDGVGAPFTVALFTPTRAAVGTVRLSRRRGIGWRCGWDCA